MLRSRGGVAISWIARLETCTCETAESEETDSGVAKEFSEKKSR